MEKTSANLKKFIIEYFNALSGAIKTEPLCDQYMTDTKLKEHIIFFDAIFPKYEVFADEMTVEGNRVVVRARLTGIHEGDFNGIPPTFNKVDMPFAIGYTLENGKISDHWMIADQVILMQQLGVEEARSEA